MSNYVAHNTNVIKNRLKSAAEQIQTNILKLCQEAMADLYRAHAEGFKGRFGTNQFPRWTGHLAASTGAAIYCNGVFESYVPNAPLYEEEQVSDDKQLVNGRELLESAIANGATKYTSGIWIVLYSAVPYAAKINIEGSPIWRGRAFFDVLKHVILDAIINGLEPIYEDVEGGQGGFDFEL